MKGLKREVRHYNIPVLKNDKIINVNKKAFFTKLGVDSIIRLHPQDFFSVNKKRIFLTHFNLQNTDHSHGKKYALALIIKPGFFDGDKQKLPVLSFDKIIIAECVNVRNNVPYNKLTSKDFNNSLKNIKSVSQLKKAIIRRYKHSMPYLSSKKILSLGVGITELRIKKIN